MFLNFLFLHVILLSEIALIVAFRSPMFTSSLRVRIHVLCFFLFNFLFCKITRLQYYMTKMLVYYITKILRYYKKLHKKLLNYNTSIKTTPKIKKITVLIPLIVQNYSIAVKMLVILSIASICISKSNSTLVLGFFLQQYWQKTTALV